MRDDITFVLDIISQLTIILGLPIAIFQYLIAKKKEKQDREYGTYNSLDEKYLEFQKLCLEFPQLDIFDIKDNDSKELNIEEQKQELILLTMLFSIFERAFLLYSDQNSEIKKRQWSGWDNYIDNYCKRENFRNAWLISGNTFDTKFEKYMLKSLSKASNGKDTL